MRKLFPDPKKQGERPTSWPQLLTHTVLTSAQVLAKSSLFQVTRAQRRRDAESDPLTQTNTNFVLLAVAWELPSPSLHTPMTRSIPGNVIHMGCTLLHFRAPFHCHCDLKEHQQDSDSSLIHIKYTKGEMLNKPSHLEPSFPLVGHVCLDLFLLCRGSGRI